MLTPLFEYQLEAVSKNDSDRYLNMKAIDKFEKERETRQEPAEKGGGEARIDHFNRNAIDNRWLNQKKKRKTKKKQKKTNKECPRCWYWFDWSLHRTLVGHGHARDGKYWLLTGTWSSRAKWTLHRLD